MENSVKKYSNKIEQTSAPIAVAQWKRQGVCPFVYLQNTPPKTETKKKQKEKNLNTAICR